MAKKTSSAAPRQTVSQEQISVGGEIDLPEVTRDSIYPWENLQKADPGKSHIFVAFGDKETAKKKAASIQGSGRNYFAKRKIPLSVVARAMEKNGVWGVAAIAVAIEEETSEE